MSSPLGRALVYGGKGALGSVVVNHLKSNGWWVVSADLVVNDHADANVLVKDEGWIDQSKTLDSGITNILEGQKLDAVLCVAGGWAGGNAADKDFIKNCDLTWKQSVWSSAIAAEIASKHMKGGGLLILTGAKAALDGGTPGMIGYGLAKAAVHHLVKSLAEPKSGLPDDATALAILPVTLDTPMNRKWMPKADFGTWTPLEYVAELLLKWSSGKDRPSNGSLVQLITKDGDTNLEMA
ncbi:hypothetical protein CHUAL_010047 [Chamberlinius hualienensis]